MNNISPLLALKRTINCTYCNHSNSFDCRYSAIFYWKKSRKEAGRAAENYAGELTVN